jgi:hypothetical protein
MSPPAFRRIIRGRNGDALGQDVGGVAVNLWVRGGAVSLPYCDPLQPTVEPCLLPSPVTHATVWPSDRRPLRHPSGTPSNRNRPPLAMVLVHELCHLSGRHWSIDADGRTRFAIPLTVLTHDQPTTIGALDDLWMMDLSHAPKTPLCRTSKSEHDAIHSLGAAAHGRDRPLRTRPSRELIP